MPDAVLLQNLSNSSRYTVIVLIKLIFIFELLLG